MTEEHRYIGNLNFLCLATHPVREMTFAVRDVLKHYFLKLSHCKGNKLGRLYFLSVYRCHPRILFTLLAHFLFIVYTLAAEFPTWLSDVFTCLSVLRRPRPRPVSRPVSLGCWDCAKTSTISFFFLFGSAFCLVSDRKWPQPRNQSSLFGPVLSAGTWVLRSSSLPAPRYALDEFGTARRSAVVRGFIDALTRGGPGGTPRPIEMHSHDPLRYFHHSHY